MSKPKSRKPLSDKQIEEDIAFYHRLKAMPPEKRALIAPEFDAMTAAYEQLLAARETVRLTEEAALAAKQAVQESRRALCDARIAGLGPTRPDDEPDDDTAAELAKAPPAPWRMPHGVLPKTRACPIWRSFPYRNHVRSGKHWATALARSSPKTSEAHWPAIKRQAII